MMMYLAALNSTLFVVSFLIGLHWGVIGVAGGYFFANILVTSISLYSTLYILRGHVGQLFAQIWRPIAMAVGMALAVAALQPLLLQAGVPEWLRLLLSVLFGALLYNLAAWRFGRNMLADVRKLLGARRADESSA
jgi:PST family polysaccharide transporter